MAKGKKGMGWLTNFTQVRQGPHPSVLENRSNIMVEILWRGRSFAKEKNSFSVQFWLLALAATLGEVVPLNRCSGPH